MLLQCMRSICSCDPDRTFVGALGQAFTSDRFGRRGSILIWSGIFTIGTAIQTATVHSIVQITIGRFIAGLGVGALSGMYRLPCMNERRSPMPSHRTLVQWRDGTQGNAWYAPRVVPAANHHRVSSALEYEFGMY